MSCLHVLTVCFWFDLKCPLWLFQIVILVVDSTDRERLTMTKEELHQMLTHEVKKSKNKKDSEMFFVSAQTTPVFMRRCHWSMSDKKKKRVVIV